MLDSENAVRVRFELERNRVLRFVVQLECCFDGEWYPVVRYDTAHGFAHRDVLYPSGKVEKTELMVQDYNDALTFALRDLSQKWEEYRARYEQWISQQM